MPDDWKYEPAHDAGLPRKERERSLRREAGLISVLAAHAWGGLTRLYLRTFHRLEIEGREHLPEPPFILIANHASHLDALALAAAVPRRWLARVFPLAAGDTFFERPLLSAFAASCLNALPIWRKSCGSHSLAELRDRLAAERCIYLLFPEGTRSRTGAMGAFKPGIGKLVCASTVPVVPCRIAGAWEAWPPGANYPRSAKVRIRIGKPVGFSGTENDRAGWQDTARRLEEAVRALGGEI